MDQERCQVVLKARELAEKKGFNPDEIGCPVEQVCTGEVCIYLDKSESSSQLGKFYDRLDKWKELNAVS